MDLNLVRVFVTIYETGSLTAASERLFVTQSAVSQSLGRLRVELGDPLFERAGRGVNATPVAEDVYPGFREALRRIDRAIDRAQPFDAATSERRFRIALSELGEIGWVPELIRNVHESAPGVHVEVVPLVVEQLPDWLSRGSVDLAISVADLPEMFERTLVKRQRYMVLMSEAHPLANEQLTLSSYADAPRAVVAGDSGATLLRAAEERAGVHALPTLAVGHFATLPQLLTGDSPFIAAAPGTIADEWASGWGLHQAPLPFPMDPIELVLYRRQTSQHLGALDWFHQQVAREVTTSRGQFGALRGDAT